MRLPTRLHITGAHDNTIRIDTDAGRQTRLFHFDGSKGNSGSASLQGESVASWRKQQQQRGFVPSFGPPKPG